MVQNRTYCYQHRSMRLPVVDFRFQLEFILDNSVLVRRGMARSGGVVCSKSREAAPYKWPQKPPDFNAPALAARGHTHLTYFAAGEAFWYITTRACIQVDSI
jgi:hypothetical protein